MVQIDKNFSIESDSYQWILKYESDAKSGKRRSPKGIIEGEYTSKNQWYYPNLKLLLKAYLDKSLKGSKTVIELLSKLEDSMTSIDNLEIVCTMERKTH